MKLTDTQLVLLSKASQREDRALEVPPKLKGGAAQKVAGKLLTDGLVEEIRARGTLPIWRRDDENCPLALRITKFGLKAIRVEDAPIAAEEADEGRRPARRRPTGKPKAVTGGARKRKSKEAARRRATGRDRPDSKQAHVIGMLSSPEGATLAAIMEATGWQQHSVRGFLAGAVRKKLGLTLVSEKTDGARVYRIAPTGGPGQTARKDKSLAA